MGIFDRFKQQEGADTSGAQAAAIKPSKSAETSSAKDSDGKKAAKGQKVKESKKKNAFPEELRGVIKHPLVTEKAATMTSLSKYAFVVRADANRVAVRAAVRAMYGVDPVSVNIMNMRGKRVRFGRTQGARKNWKKAIVTFPKGTTIDAYEGV